jgi:hypothetical protein
MLKPTSTYKMSKPTKTGLALGRFKDTESRNAWKRSMIQAELSAAVPSRAPKREGNKG